jgi:type II secretory pathway component GspD/PulD (secretin)
MIKRRANRIVPWWTVAVVAIPGIVSAIVWRPLHAGDEPVPAAATASVDSAAAGSAPLEPAEAKEIVFSFSDTPWEEVARWLADIGKKSLLVESKPTGTFNYFDKRKYSFKEAIDVINSVLLGKGHVLLARDNFLVLADLKEGVPPHLIQRIDVADLPKKGRTELVKVLLTLKGLVADEAKKEFESISSPYGKILSLPSTNQLLIVDTAQNVGQIVSLIESLEGDQGKADLRAFPLKHVSARDIERVIRDLLGLPSRESEKAPASPAGPAPGGGGGRGDEGGRGDRMRSMIAQFMQGQGGGGGPPQPAAPGAPQRNPNGPFVSVDERTNTLFVAATPDKLALVAQVVQRLDVEQEKGLMEDQTPRIEVYPVSAGDADGLAQVLQKVFDASADLKVTAHPDGRALIIYATPRDHERLAGVLSQIKSEGLRVEVIPLRTLDATNTSELIRALLGQKSDEQGGRFRFSFFDEPEASKSKSGPWVEPDAERNRLVVRGTEVQIREVRNLLIKLGEAGLASDVDGNAGPGRYRVIPLGGQDPKVLAESVERLWRRIDPTQPIRIEVLGQPKPMPTDGIETPKDLPDSKPAPKDSGRRRDRIDSHFQPVGYQEEGAAEPEVEPMPKESTDQPATKEGVTIVVGPDNITVFSDDLKALDMVENLLNTVVRGEQSSQFAYYYLKVADAQETALLIDNALYGQERRQSFFFVEEEKPNKARILPDTRANALLIVGPPAEQRKIEQLLEVVDAEERPENAATPRPYVIPVQFADASEIAQTVREVFAIQLFDSRSRQQPRINVPSFGFGFGFGGSSSNRQNQGKENQQGKLTVGVDRETNSLVISAPLEIYREVEKLVRTLDTSAGQSGRSARVVTLKNASPDAVERALGNLLGVRTTADLEAEREEKARLRAEEEDERREQSGRNRNRNRNLEDTLRNLQNGPGGFLPRGGLLPF